MRGEYGANYWGTVGLRNVEKAQFLDKTITLPPATSNNIIKASSSSSYEEITGTAEDDTVDHGYGPALIDGGGGTDTVVYFANSADFSMVDLSGILRIQPLNGQVRGEYGANYWGTVELRNIEKVQFLDKTVKLNNSVVTDSTDYSISPATISINENVDSQSFIITRSGGLSAETVYVSTTTTEGFSNNGDYDGILNRAVSFGAGETTAQVAVRIMNDAISESAEMFGLIVQKNTSDPAATFLAKSTFTIVDDDTVTGNSVNLNFFINPQERNSEIKVTQGSFLVLNTKDLHGSGPDAAAIDLGLTAGTSVYSFASGTIVGAYSGYTDGVDSTSGPPSWGNYVTAEYFFSEIGKSVSITYAHLSKASASYWVDALNASKATNGPVNIYHGAKIGEVAGETESPFDVHLHLSFATITQRGGNYPFPNYIAWAEPTNENAALLSSFSIDGQRLSTLREGDFITGASIKTGVQTTADRLFNWAENTYGNLFPNQSTSQELIGYYARIYENGNALGEQNDNIFFYDGSSITLVGRINDFLTDAIAAGF